MGKKIIDKFYNDGSTYYIKDFNTKVLNEVKNITWSGTQIYIDTIWTDNKPIAIFGNDLIQIYASTEGTIILSMALYNEDKSSTTAIYNNCTFNLVQGWNTITVPFSVSENVLNYIDLYTQRLTITQGTAVISDTVKNIRNILML